MVPKLFKRERPVHFLHVRKTAGTAIRFALREHLDGPRYRLVMHEHDTRLSDLPVGERVVVFLRDPVSRFVSGFDSRLREGRPRYHRPWTLEEREAFTQFSSADALARALSAENPRLQQDAEAAMKAIRHVQHHYGFWFDNEDYVRSRAADFFHIGFQETLDDDFAGLRSKLGLPVSVQLPVDDVAAHRSPFARTELSACAHDNLRAWYARDYDFLALFHELESDIPKCS